MTTTAKKEKICETCCYEDIWIFDYPCRDCNLYNNDKWEEKDDDHPENR